MKTKFFIIYIIANLFFGQLYAIEHLTEHGFEEHEHNEVSCELNIFYEQSKFLNDTDNVLSYSISYNSFSNTNLIVFKNFLIRYISPLTRAPPYLS